MPGFDFTPEGRTFAFGLAEGMSRSPPTSTSSPTVPDPLGQQLQGILTGAMASGSNRLTQEVIPTAERASETAADHAVQQVEAAAGRLITQGTTQLRDALAEGLQGGAETGIDGLRTELATTRRWATGLGIGLAITATALAVYLVRSNKNAVMATRARTTLTRKPDIKGHMVTRATISARTRRVA